MKKLILILSFLSTFVCGKIEAQNDLTPCFKGSTFTNVLIGKDVSISSTKDGGTASWSNDGIKSTTSGENQVTKTYFQENPWWQADLKDNYTLETIRLYFPKDAYPDGLKNYYILMSEAPFSDGNLFTQLTSPYVSHVYVESSQESGVEIPLEYKQAQYVRIQQLGKGGFVFGEIEINGTELHDICGDGIDNDCDGSSDCDDTDCGAIIYNTDPKMPTCPYCKDGSIGVQAMGKNLVYSIDGGKTFIKCGYNCNFANLPEGDYEILVKNSVTGCTVLKKVKLKAATGNVNECCPNGSAETGTYGGWTGSDGKISDMSTITNTIIASNNKQHSIIKNNSGAIDKLSKGGIPLVSPTGSSYFIRLGDEVNGSRFSSIQYCIEVKECNQDFFFNYAIAMDDPPKNHNANERPYFTWVIKNEKGVILESFPKIIANSNNPFFSTLPDNSNIVYKSWTCKNLDLHQYLGQKICIEFIAADCTEGAHAGYAYIDGLCDKENSEVKLNLSLNSNVFCKNQKVVADALKSTNVTRYSWEVCRYLGGAPINCFSTKESYDRKPILSDVLGFFFNPPHNPAEPLQCGDKFVVTLFASNDCGTAKIAKEFTYLCDDAPEINYPDILNCTSKTNIQITGSNNCKNCSFQWTPSQYLNNSKLEFPTIMGGNNPSIPLGQTYSVTATNSLGCLTMDKMKIFNSDELFGKMKFTFEDEQCVFTTYIDIEFDEPVDVSKIDVDIYVDSEKVAKAVAQTSGIAKKHRFKVIGKLRRCSDHTFHAIVKYKVAPEIFNQLGNCTLEEITTRKGISKYGACDAAVFIPNVITPNGDGINDTFNPFFAPNMIFWAHLIIFDRDGGIMFDGTATAPPNEFLTGNESAITWDGYLSGKKLSSGVYTYLIEYKSCSDSKNCTDLKDSALSLLTSQSNSVGCSDVTLIW